MKWPAACRWDVARSFVFFFCDLLVAELSVSMQAVGLEALLWKHAFYRPIQDFRRRLTRSHVNSELTQKTRRAYILFLNDAIEYYLELCDVLRTALSDQANECRGKYVGSNYEISCSAARDNADARLALGRALICIGDLERYIATAENSTLNDQRNDVGHGPIPASSALYAKSWKAYADAALVFPEGGNAWNQLAVLSFLQEDVLSATYYYLRALFAPRPFEVAKGNLLTLFSSGRGMDHEGSSSNRSSSPAPKSIRHEKIENAIRRDGRKISKHEKSGKSSSSATQGRASPVLRGSRPTTMLVQSYSWSSVELIEALYTRINLDKVPEIISQKILPDLEELLHRLKLQCSAKGRQAAERRISNSNRLSLSLMEPPHYLLSLTSSLILLIFHLSGLHRDESARQYMESTGISEAAKADDVRSACAARAYATYAVCVIGAKLAATASLLQIDSNTNKVNIGLSSPIVMALRPILKWLATTQSQHLLSTQFPISRLSAYESAQLAAETAIHGFEGSKALFWRALKALSASLSGAIAYGNRVQEDIASLSKDSKEHTTLPEDVQLCGFAPFIGLDEFNQVHVVTEDLNANRCPGYRSVCKVRAAIMWRDLEEISRHAELWLQRMDHIHHETELLCAIKSFVQGIYKLSSMSRTGDWMPAQQPLSEANKTMVMNVRGEDIPPNIASESNGKRKCIDMVKDSTENHLVSDHLAGGDMETDADEEEEILFLPSHSDDVKKYSHCDTDMKKSELDYEMKESERVHSSVAGQEGVEVGSHLAQEWQLPSSTSLDGIVGFASGTGFRTLPHIIDEKGHEMNAVASMGRTIAPKEKCREVESEQRLGATHPISKSYLSLVPSHLPAAPPQNNGRIHQGL